jgi:nitrite reductase (NADH) large subunit
VNTQAEAIKIIGRFLIYYRDNAKWLERTYDFVPRIGLERLKEIIVNDSLGIGEQLDAEVEKTAAAYVDPWLEREHPVYPGQFEETRRIALPLLT